MGEADCDDGVVLKTGSSMSINVLVLMGFLCCFVIHEKMTYKCIILKN